MWVGGVGEEIHVLIPIFLFNGLSAATPHNLDEGVAPETSLHETAKARQTLNPKP